MCTKAYDADGAIEATAAARAAADANFMLTHRRPTTNICVTVTWCVVRQRCFCGVLVVVLKDFVGSVIGVLVEPLLLLISQFLTSHYHFPLLHYFLPLSSAAGVESGRRSDFRLPAIMPTSNAKFLSSAPPPWHSVAFVVSVALVVMRSLPTLEALDGAATLDAFVSPVIVGSLSPSGIAAIRLSIAAFIFAVTAKRLLGPLVRVNPTYRPNSRLIPEPIDFVGLQGMAPFTWWCWVLLGVSFLLSGTIPLLYALGRSDLIGPWHLRLALVTFEVVAPCAFLVSFTVKHALWPHALKSKGAEGTVVFRNFNGVVTHNFNAIFVLLEVALVGGIKVEISHVAISPMLGLIYILFTWWISDKWNTKSPQFIYFFHDTTLPGYAPTLALAVLLVVLLVFYSIFSVAHGMLEHLPGGVWAHAAGAFLAAAALCRFRD